LLSILIFTLVIIKEKWFSCQQSVLPNLENCAPVMYQELAKEVK